MPQLSFITYPVKYISVAVFAAPLLAAFALANFGKVQRRLLPLGAVLLALIIAIMFWTRLAPMPGDDSRSDVAERRFAGSFPGFDGRNSLCADVPDQTFPAPLRAAGVDFGRVAGRVHARAGAEPDRFAKRL